MYNIKFSDMCNTPFFVVENWKFSEKNAHFHNSPQITLTSILQELCLNFAWKTTVNDVTLAVNLYWRFLEAQRE